MYSDEIYSLTFIYYFCSKYILIATFRYGEEKVTTVAECNKSELILASMTGKFFFFRQNFKKSQKNPILLQISLKMIAIRNTLNLAIF